MHSSFFTVLFFCVLLNTGLCSTLHARDTSPENIKPQESFVYSLQYSLQSLGVTTDIASIMVYNGCAFSPCLDTQEVCFSAATLSAQETLTPHFTAAFGVIYDQYAIPLSSWAKASVRHFVKQKITYQDDAESTLIKGGWSTPALGTLWGVATEVNSNSVILGTQPWGDAELRYTPQNIIFLSLTNSSITPARLLHQTLQNAIDTIRDNTQTHEDENILQGVAVIDVLIKRIHNSPICPECGNTSYICLRDVLKSWQEQSTYAITWLKKEHPSLSPAQQKMLHEAAYAYVDFRDACTVCLSLPLREICASPRTQLQLLPYLNILRTSLAKAGNVLAKVTGSDPLVIMNDTVEVSEHHRQETLLVVSLPLFSQIRNGAYPFLCSSLMAGQLAGSSEYPEWSIGIAGIPASICVDMRTLAPVYMSESSYSLKQKLIQANGYYPLCFVYSQESPVAVKSYIRHRILHSLDKGVPVIGEYFASTNDTAVIIGYKDYGKTLIARSSDDTNTAFSTSKSLPHVIWIYDKKFSTPAPEEALQIALEYYINMFNTSFTNNLYCGKNVLLQMHARCLEYHASPALLSTNFACSHRAFYKDYIAQRRNFYRFLETAAQRAPVVSIPLMSAYDNIIKEVETLNSALTDDIALTWLNGTYWPPGWTGSGAVAEAALLKSALEYEERAYDHIRIALRELKRLHSPAQ